MSIPTSSRSAKPSASAPAPPCRSSTAKIRSTSPSDKRATQKKSPIRNERSGKRLPVPAREPVRRDAEMVGGDDHPVQDGRAYESNLQKPATRGPGEGREQRGSSFAFHPPREDVVLHDRNLGISLERIAAEELRLIAPRLAREA